MAQNNLATWSEHAKVLQAAIAALLAFVPADAEAIETLDLELLTDIAWGGDGRYPGLAASGNTAKLRAYLNSLAGFTTAHMAGSPIPRTARDDHIHVAMQLLSGTQTNLEALGAHQSIVISSILPVSPTDAELTGRRA